MAIVYLLHFARPYHHARHYLGTTKDLAKRLTLHREGKASSLMAAVARAGIDWICIRTWQGSFPLEKKLKRSKCSPRFCPICSQVRKRGKRK